MKIQNSKDLNINNFMYCYDEDIKQHLLENNITYINRVDNCYVFIKSYTLLNIISKYLSQKVR